VIRYRTIQLEKENQIPYENFIFKISLGSQFIFRIRIVNMSIRMFDSEQNYTSQPVISIKIHTFCMKAMPPENWKRLFFGTQINTDKEWLWGRGA
jgi:hypothetical protein